MSVEDEEAGYLPEHEIQPEQIDSIETTLELFNSGAIIFDPEYSRNNFGYCQVDQGKLQEYIDKKKNETDNQEDGDEPQIWKGEQDYARGLTQTAIKLIYNSGLFDKYTIRDAARYVGPGNSIMTSQNYSSFDNYLLERQHKPEDVEQWDGYVPWPQNRADRNKLVQLEISESHITALAGQIYGQLPQAGIELEQNDAVRLAGIGIAAHEFGHGIDFALNNTERKTFINTALLQESPPNHVRSQAARIHQEHFVRSIEDYAILLALMNEYDVAPEAVSKLRINDHFRQQTLEKFQQLDKLVNTFELTYPGLFHLDQYVSSEIGKYYFNSLEPYLAYNLPPYTLDEVKLLSQKNPINEG